MREILLLLVVALVAAAIVFGVIVAITGAARGLQPAEPDERARRLPGDRPLAERDLGSVRFDAVVRGYRMAQVDAALRRVSYDLGYKQELIAALEAEVAALRDGRTADADLLRDRRLAAAAPANRHPAEGVPSTAAPADTGAGPAADDVPVDRDAPGVDGVGVSAEHDAVLARDDVPAAGGADRDSVDGAGASPTAGDADTLERAAADAGAAAGEPPVGDAGASASDEDEPAADGGATTAGGDEPAGAAAGHEGEPGDGTAPDADRAGPSNGRPGGAARRVADQPAVS
ncbi:DivIVA domain-containing protein [Actinocatenispora thailandica]|uniref:DivIVA domain-containing protein n=1 Tax=Actinocatenispora thailandica TaxID=227318 RepID=UPI0033858706